MNDWRHMKNYQTTTPTPARFRYIIELDTPFWPRKLADELMNVRSIAPRLVGVTDLQNDTHIYGATYSIQDRAPRLATKAGDVR